MKGKPRPKRRGLSLLKKAAASLAVFATTYSLILPAVTLSADTTYCNQVEHVHTEQCVANCSLEEHLHSLQCESDPNADVETEEDWIAELSKLPDVPDGPDKAAMIAQSQVGQERSEDNFLVTDEETSQKVGWSRYGAFAGDSYQEEISGAFASWVLHYSGSDAELPGGQSLDEWEEVHEGQLSKGLGLALPGDLLIRTDEQGIKTAGILSDRTSEEIHWITIADGEVEDQKIDQNEQVSWTSLSGFDQDTLNEGLELHEDPVVDEVHDPCGFKPFPESNITDYKVQWKLLNQTSWTDYQENTQLPGTAQLRVQVQVTGLAKETIKNDHGEYYISLPVQLKSSESETGSNIEHKNAGESKIEILGQIKPCSLQNQSHVHIHLNNPDAIHSDMIRNGSFYVNLKSDLTEVDKDRRVNFTLKGKTTAIVFEEDVLPETATVEMKKDNALGDKAFERIEGEHSVFRARYDLWVETGNLPVPDVVLTDYIEWNRQIVEYEKNSIKLTKQGAEDIIPISAENIAWAVPGANSYSLTYTNSKNETVSHIVQKNNGFSAYVGTLEPNSRYHLRYSVLVRTDGEGNIVNGSSANGRNVRNYGVVYSREQEKASDYEDVPVRGVLTINKQAGDVIPQNDGSAKIQFTIDVSAPADNNYRLKDVVVDDEILFKKLNNNEALGAYPTQVEIENIQLQRNGNEQPIPLTLNKNGSDNSKYQAHFSIGTMDPGDTARVTYDVHLNKELFGLFTKWNENDIRMFNSGTITRTTQLEGDANPSNYSVRSETVSTLKKLQWIQKHHSSEKTVKEKPIIMGTENVFEMNGIQASDVEFTVPAGSFFYSITLNEQAIADMKSAEFTDSLGDTGAEFYRYSGFMKIEAFDGIPSGTPAAVAYVRLPNAKTFTLRMEDIPTLSALTSQTGNNISYKLSYYVEPHNLPASHLILTNTMEGKNIGVGYENAVHKISASSEVSTQVGESLNVSASKQGVFILENENEIPGSGYENGRIVWLMKVDVNSIPEHFKLIDELKNPNTDNDRVWSHFLDNSLTGIYKGSKLFTTGKFTGFEQLHQDDRNFKFSYQDLLDELSNKRISDQAYSVTYDGTPLRKMTIEFNSKIEMNEGESLYLLVESTPDEKHQWASSDLTRSNKWYNNTLFWQLGDLTPSYLNEATISHRHYNCASKAWGNDFVYRRDKEGLESIQIFNSNSQFPNKTNADTMRSVLFAAIDKTLMEDHVPYTDWRINANKYTDIKGDELAMTGEFEIVEKIPSGSSFVTAYLTDDRNGVVYNPNSSPKIAENGIQISTDETGQQIVRIRILDVQQYEFTLHVVTKLNMDWDLFTALSTNTPSDSSLHMVNKATIVKDGRIITETNAAHDIALPGVLSKTAPQRGSQTLAFNIVLNEKELDLIENEDYIDLEDSYNTHQMKIDHKSISIEDKDGNAVDGYRISYSSIANDGQQTMTIRNLPDKTKLIITYNAKVQAPPDTTVENLTNTVTWRSTAPNKPSSCYNKNYTVDLGGLMISGPEYEQLEILKVNGDDADEPLAGAKFKLYKVTMPDEDGGKIIYTPIGEPEYETDGSGKIQIASQFLDNGEQHLRENVIYAIREVKAPEGYVLDPSYIHFVFQNEHLDGFTTNLPTENLHAVISGEKLSITFQNYRQKSRIRVVKKFKSENATPGDYWFGIYSRPYQKNDRPEQIKKLVIPNNFEGDTATLFFDDLDKDSQWHVYELDPKEGTPALENGVVNVNSSMFGVQYDNGNQAIAYGVFAETNDGGQADVTLSETGAQVTITPNEGFLLGSVSVNGTAVTPVVDRLSYELPLNESKNVSAEFIRDHYTEGDPYVFPKAGQTSTLEAEHFILHNTGGDNETWKLEKASRNWASNGKVINSCNAGDSISLYYTAEPGDYRVVLRYRSGNSNNGFTISEENGKLTSPGVPTVGQSDREAATTYTKEFMITVNQAGLGHMILAGINTSTNSAGAPIMDCFEITRISPDISELEEAVARANEEKNSERWETYSEESKSRLESVLHNAQEMLKNPGTQTSIDQMTSELNNAINRLTNGKYRLTVMIEGEGTSDPSETIELDPGESRTVTLTPAEGFEIGAVTLNGSPVTVTDGQINIDSISMHTTINVTFNLVYYTESYPFVFPVNGQTIDLEAEYSQIHNNTNGDNGYPCVISRASWASNGKFVNACNNGDYIEIPYVADQAGTYQVTLVYRSGSNSNRINISETTGNKITAKQVGAGAGSASATHTKNFELVITEAGPGILRISGDSNKCPQMDVFHITAPAAASQSADMTMYQSEVPERLLMNAQTDEQTVEEQQVVTDTVTITNNPAYKLPHTGGTGSQTIQMIGAAAVSAGLMGWMRKRRHSGNQADENCDFNQ